LIGAVAPDQGRFRHDIVWQCRYDECQVAGNGGLIMAERAARTTKLDLRLSPEAKQKLQAAALASRRSVSEFVLDSALVRAEETLADRTRFGLDAERWDAFLEALDAPPRDLPRLARLLREPSVFEGGTAG
jgi:uncharacterized protein (DUF1778 family)